MKATDAVLQKTPFSFDASVWEFYAPLMAGARLVMAQPGGHQDAAYLVEVMEREGVTRLQGVPTLLRMLVSEGGLERCTQLREVFSGGEVLGRELAESLLRAHSEREVIQPVRANGSDDRCDVAGGGARQSVGGRRGGRLGGPSRTCRCMCWTHEMQVVPVGMVGELYIGGDGIGARVSEPAGAHSREVRASSVQRGAGSAFVPDGRHGAVARGRRVSVCRSRGCTGEGAWVPRRVG